MLTTRKKRQLRTFQQYLPGPDAGHGDSFPGYLEKHGLLTHPRDLPKHHGIGWRPNPQVAPYRWEFTEIGREFAVDVDPRVTTNDMRVMIQLACAGAGLTLGMEETFRPHIGYIARAELVPLLEEFCTPFPWLLPLLSDPPQLAAQVTGTRQLPAQNATLTVGLASGQTRKFAAIPERSVYPS